jgi:hypothetical protein
VFGVIDRDQRDPEISQIGETSLLDDKISSEAVGGLDQDGAHPIAGDCRHAAAMAEKMRGRPYQGDAREEIRGAGFWGFWKLGREIVGPDGELVYPERCNRLDYEGEVAIVLGKPGVDLKPPQLRPETVRGLIVHAADHSRTPVRSRSTMSRSLPQGHYCLPRLRAWDVVRSAPQPGWRSSPPFA